MSVIDAARSVSVAELIEKLQAMPNQHGRVLIMEPEWESMFNPAVAEQVVDTGEGSQELVTVLYCPYMTEDRTAIDEDSVAWIREIGTPAPSE